MCQITIFQLINFSIFVQTLHLIRIPLLVIVRKLYQPLISFNFFVSTSHAQYSRQNTALLYIFSSMLDDSLFFFSSFYNHLMPSLNFRPPFLSTPFNILSNFCQPSFVLAPHFIENRKQETGTHFVTEQSEEFF